MTSEKSETTCQGNLSGPASTDHATAKPRRKGTKPTQTQLARLASQNRDADTKVAAKTALRDAGHSAAPQFVDALLGEISHQDGARENRLTNRIRARLGHVPERTQAARSPVVLPAGIPVERLNALRVRTVTQSAKRVLRHGAAGGTSFDVKFARTASEVRYVVRIGMNWNTYAGKFKGWAANEDHHFICVPTDWRYRVLRRGLAELDGMLTLDAHQLDAPGGTQLYAATWVRQGRGFGVHVERG